MQYGNQGSGFGSEGSVEQEPGEQEVEFERVNTPVAVTGAEAETDVVKTTNEKLITNLSALDRAILTCISQNLGESPMVKKSAITESPLVIAQVEAVLQSPGEHPSPEEIIENTLSKLVELELVQHDDGSELVGLTVNGKEELGEDEETGEKI